MTATSTDTYDLIGIREDLADIIYNVDPSDTPFLSMAPKTKATQTLHEWQTDTFAAVADNKAIEGADAAFAPAAATVRVGNNTQISDKTAIISGTMEAVNKAGRAREMNYQMLKRGVEIKRDMENALVGLNNAKAVGSSTVARELGGYTSWLATNDSFGTGGVSPTGDGTNARTDGTQRAFTEALLDDVIDLIWEAGGKPDVIMLGSHNKRVANAFLGRATTTDHNVAARSIINAADVYKSDYGDLKIIPNRFSRARDCLVYQKDKWAIAFLRNMVTKPIAATGDAEKRQVLVEYTLESRNEKASGLIADLTTA